jgi:agmatinase
VEGFLFWGNLVLVFLPAMNADKNAKIAAFDPNGAGIKGTNLYGLPFNADESEVIIVPVPWEVTVSYAAGTASGPQAILDASLQVDLYDTDAPEAWKAGIFMLPISEELANESAELRDRAEHHIESLISGEAPDPNSPALQSINDACQSMVATVKAQTAEWLQKGKLVGLLGGDHSTPLGFLQALAERHPSFGILQIDAHCDLRIAYEDFAYSHASIMYNALKIPQISRLVQVGIRDYCQQEAEMIRDSQGRIVTFFDEDLRNRQYEGETWKSLVQEMVNALPQEVYISFDIDGLIPGLCPNTGTPVAGGLEFAQAVYLLRAVVQSGRRIIGFDLNEVAPGEDEWDANVGARLLYKLVVFAGLSQGIMRGR